MFDTSVLTRESDVHDCGRISRLTVFERGGGGNVASYERPFYEFSSRKSVKSVNVIESLVHDGRFHV